MQVFFFILIAAGAWLIGVFGWAQIIGAIQNFSTRGAKMILPFVLWLIIIGVTLLLVLKFIPDKIWAWVIGMGISLIIILGQGKIE